MEQVVPTPSGSALRLSQPLSGSSHARVPRLYFAPQPFLTDRLPFEVFPSQESRSSLEATGSLAVIHPLRLTNPSRPYHRRFPRLPRPKAQLPDSPDDYEIPFGELAPTTRYPWTPNGRTARLHKLHPLRSFIPPASPFTSRRVAPSRRPVLPWCSSPSETSTNLGPSTPPDPKIEHGPTPESASPRPGGPQPPEPGTPVLRA